MVIFKSNFLIYLFFFTSLWGNHKVWGFIDSDTIYEQNRKKNCEIFQKKTCEPYPFYNVIKNFVEIQLSAECQVRYEKNHCDLIKSTASKEDKTKFTTCLPNEICDQFSLGDLKSCTINGFKLQFSPENLSVMGLTLGAIAMTGSATIGTLIGFPFLIYGASEKSRECDQDLTYKQTVIALHNLMLRPSEKKLQIARGEKDEPLLKIPCSELRSFLQTRIDVMVQRRNEAKIQNKPLAGEVSAFDLALAQTKCLSTKARITSFCEDLSGFVTGTTIGAGVGVAAKAIVKAKVPKFYNSAQDEEVDLFIRDIKQSPHKSLETLFLWNKINKISYKEIKSPTKLNNGIGLGYLRIEKGNLEGKDVFLKVTTQRADGSFAAARDAKRGRDSWYNEVFWTKKLSDLKIGPQLQGVTVTSDGQRAIVTEFVEGFHYQGNVFEALKKVSPSPQLLESLKNIRQVLRDNSIESNDLQLILKNDRAVVIDPEMFRNFKLDPKYPERTINESHYNIDQLISTIELKLAPATH